jgi:predicted lactoylglutathione lyase
MATQIYVNLPVKDLQKSIAFFTQLDFTFNAQFTDQNATCMIVGENIFVMLLVEEFFQTFTTKKMVDTASSTEVILAISAESRAQVDALVNKAFQAGATSYNEPQDHGWMYSWSFQDLDGHLWEIMYADPAALNQDSAGV